MLVHGVLKVGSRQRPRESLFVVIEGENDFRLIGNLLSERMALRKHRRRSATFVNKALGKTRGQQNVRNAWKPEETSIRTLSKRRNGYCCSIISKDRKPSRRVNGAVKRPFPLWLLKWGKLFHDSFHSWQSAILLRSVVTAREFKARLKWVLISHLTLPHSSFKLLRKFAQFSMRMLQQNNKFNLALHSFTGELTEGKYCTTLALCLASLARK